MAVDQWLQFFSHLASKETRGSWAIRLSPPNVKMKCCCNTPSLALTHGRKSHLPSFAAPHSAPRAPAGGLVAVCCRLLTVVVCSPTGLHQFQRQRRMRDPVPPAVCVQPHIVPAGAQPQSQVHLRSVLCQEMSA